MKRMTIGKRISLACVALVTLTITLGCVSILKTTQMNTKTESITKVSLPNLGNLAIMVKTAYKSTYFAALSISAENLADKTKGEAVVTDELRKFDDAARSYQSNDTSVRGREIMTRVVSAHAAMFTGWMKVTPLSRAMQNKEAYAMWVSELTAPIAERAQGIEDLIAYNSGTASELGATAVQTGQNARLWAVAILIFSIVSGGLLAFFIVRGINKSLTQAVTELSDGAAQVTSASGQVSGSSQSLAQSASEQAASLEETSASSVEMAAMTSKNTQSAQEAARHMNVVSQRVVEANGTLNGMIASMQDIGASSNKISKIIKVIDEIAFQTNILALNAAVEAARAGEAGMGFAVVADEVRNLAQRSAQAAKDTASLIEESILKSGEGSKKLGEVTVAIHAITESTNKVKKLVDEVEASSKEQSVGIDQISKAVSQMDGMTQQTAANAEEGASASEELSAQSKALMVVVDHLQALVRG